MKKKKMVWRLIIAGIMIVVIAVIVISALSDSYSGRKYSADNSSAAYYEEGKYWAAEEAEAPMSEEKASDEMAAGVMVDVDAVQNGEKLVYTANISLETRTYPQHRDMIYALQSQYGAVIEDMSESGGQYARYGSFTLRVPYQHFEEVYRLLTSDEAGWTVVSASSRVENMTKQYSKLTAQIEAYEAEKEALMALLKEAASVTETLEIQDRLAWLNSDLQYYYNQRETIDSDVEMSTVYVNLNEIEPPRVQEEHKYSFAERSEAAFSSGLEKFKDFWAEVALFFVESWTFLLVLAALLAAALLIGKAAVKRKARRRAEKPEEEPQKTEEENE